MTARDDLAALIRDAFGAGYTVQRGWLTNAIVARWRLVPVQELALPQRIVIMDTEWHDVAPGVQVRYSPGGEA